MYSFSQFAQIVNDKLGIRAADIVIDLGRIPAGFYAAVQHSGYEWRTVNVPVSVSSDVVEWDDPIPM